jgi:hypothetical protein
VQLWCSTGLMSAGFHKGLKRQVLSWIPVWTAAHASVQAAVTRKKDNIDGHLFPSTNEWKEFVTHYDKSKKGSPSSKEDWLSQHWSEWEHEIERLNKQLAQKDSAVAQKRKKDDEQKKLDEAAVLFRERVAQRSVCVSVHVYL